MRKALLLFAFAGSCVQLSAQTTVTSDKNWNDQSAVVKNSMEADVIIRTGDVDNLGFGWPEGFDPFCGRMTEAHSYPWEINPADLKGFDSILMSSKYNPDTEHRCGGDGYSGNYDAATCKPVIWSLPLDAVQGLTIKNAYLQLFIDDFQAPSYCSKFIITINGTRFVEGEKILNAIDQSGPVGKLISLPLPEEFYAALTGKKLDIYIDEVTGEGDGFALDFIRLLVNRKRENTCKGDLIAHVYDKVTNEPISGANVYLSDKTSAKTDAEGNTLLKGIPTGFEVASASAPGYADGSAGADIGEDDANEVIIYLVKGKSTAQFGNTGLHVGESINLNKILFDQGKSVIKPEAKPELDRIITFMKENPGAEIELSGHTSSEGDAALNRSLSYQRVKACKDYIVAAGIATDRILSVGYGPDKPVASNDTEAGRIQNRRVEMRLLKL